MKTLKTASTLLGALLLLATSSAFAELCAPGKKTQVLWKGDWYKATVVKAEAERCFIAYEGYERDSDEWVGPDRLKVKVLWKGEWYPAKVLKKDGAKYLVSYDGYKSEDNESVPLSSIQIR